MQGSGDIAPLGVLLVQKGRLQFEGLKWHSVFCEVLRWTVHVEPRSTVRFVFLNSGGGVG